MLKGTNHDKRCAHILAHEILKANKPLRNRNPVHRPLHASSQECRRPELPATAIYFKSQRRHHQFWLLQSSVSDRRVVVNPQKLLKFIQDTFEPSGPSGERLTAPSRTAADTVRAESAGPTAASAPHPKRRRLRRLARGPRGVLGRGAGGRVQWRRPGPCGPPRPADVWRRRRCLSASHSQTGHVDSAAPARRAARPARGPPGRRRGAYSSAPRTESRPAAPHRGGSAVGD